MVRWKKPLNFGCFQVGWFACALGAAHGWPLMGSLVIAVEWALVTPGLVYLSEVRSLDGLER